MAKYTLTIDGDETTYDKVEELLGPYSNMNDIFITQDAGETVVEFQDPKCLVELTNSMFHKAKKLTSQVNAEVYLKLIKRAKARRMTVDAYIEYVLTRHIYGE